MRLISYIFFFILLFLGISFAVLNSQKVAINYYVGHQAIALSLLLVLVFAVGSLVGILITGWLLIKVKMRNHHLRRQLKIAEKEVENLRSIPLKES